MKPRARIATMFRSSGSAQNESVRGAVAPAFSGDAKGSGAPSCRRLRATLASLALAITAFAVTAAPASAAVSAEMGTVSDVSYTSAHVTGKVSGFAGAPYSFEYSTSESGPWSPGLSGEIATGTEETVQGTMSVPRGDTKYFVRLFVNGGFVGSAISPAAPPYPSFTTLPVDPATVLAADNASEVSYTTAKASGEIERPANDDPAFDANCRFEYVTDAKFDLNGFTDAAPPVPCGIDSLTAPNQKKHVEVALEGLEPATEYHLRLTASNAGPDASLEAALTFTTLAVDPPSVVSVENASDLEYTQAQVEGVVERPNTSEDPAFDITSCNFEYVTDQQFNDNPVGEEFAGAIPVACEGVSSESPIQATGQTSVKAHLGGLAPQTTYHLRLSASNQGGSDAKVATATFATLGPVPAPSVIATDDASEVKYNSAEFTGRVLRPAGKDPALETSCRFEFISDAQYEANELASAPLFEGATPVDCAENPISADKVDLSGEIEVSAKTGLLPETTYHLRLVAENAGGFDAMVAADTFTTPEAELPTVTIDPVEAGIFTAAHVTGTVTLTDGHTSGSTPYLQVSSDGGATWSTYIMHWSHNGSPESSGERVMDDGEGLYVVKGDVTGLQPSTTYLFRIASSYNFAFSTNPPQIELIEERGEVGFSPELSITTEPPQPSPTAEDLEVTGVTATRAHFSGRVNPQAPAGPLSAAGKKAFATHWEFVCVPECKNANGNAIEGTVQGEEGAQTVTGDVKRLEPGREYTVSLIVSNEGGGDTDEDTFPTSKSPPSVKQTPGSSDGTGGYTLQGVVNPNNETITDCKFRWGPNSNELVFSTDCSPMPDPGAKPTTVEAHLTGLTTDVDYHALLVVTYGDDLEEDSGEPQKFKATLAAKEPCPANEQQRVESNSLALPECRAYEMVTPPGREGWLARLSTYDGGDRVGFASGAGNIAKSGQNNVTNGYVAERTATGWETIPDLNGSGGGTIGDAPSSFTKTSLSLFPFPLFYSEDLLSSVWAGHRLDGLDGENFYLRKPDGLFSLIGLGDVDTLFQRLSGASDDLSHFFLSSDFRIGPTVWGPGVYEYVGTGNEQPPRRADVDNSESPITACSFISLDGQKYNAAAEFSSTDGRVFVFGVAGGCGGANPPADEIWARVGGTTAVDVSASHCNRVDCNAPANATYQAAAKDGSRVYFTTTQQLVNGDTDETKDLYACDIPSGNPAPSAEKANHCAAFRQVSGGAQTGADVESVPAVSEDGSTALFTAKGVLADNEDALKEKAVAGDHNLYTWRTDAAHPDGQTTFVGRLDSDDTRNGGRRPQFTPDGRYLVFTTASQLLDTDTDTARDVYRYDADTGGLTRVSTNVFGVGGNGPFDAAIGAPTEHNLTTAISADGQKIVFTTDEPLNLAVDNNAELDAYLWTPARVSLISTGAVGGGAAFPEGSIAAVFIDDSGQNIYFQTPAALTPTDGDDQVDVYDARVGGGFNFSGPAICVGEKCQPDATPVPPKEKPGSGEPGLGNPPQPKPCPKGKVRNKKGKCVPRHKKHSAKKQHGKKHKRAGSNNGGGK